VKVEVAYRYRWIGTTAIGLSLAEAIELASHKPLGAYVRRAPDMEFHGPEVTGGDHP
jgi:hypothetical protein